jgi:hypothetical protein
MTEINMQMLKALKEFTRVMNVLEMRPRMQLVEIAELLNPVGDQAREAIATAGETQ